jgi:hypothetical protein
VQSRFNKHPESSRIYAVADAQMVAHVTHFKTKTASYYSHNSPLVRRTQVQLKNMLRHRVTISGGFPNTQGDKAKNLKVIYDDDIMYLNSHYRRIMDIDMFLIYKQLVQPMSRSELTADVSSISCQETIYKMDMNCFRNLNEGNRIPSEMIDYAMITLQAKDDLLNQMHASVHRKSILLLFDEYITYLLKFYFTVYREFAAL